MFYDGRLRDGVAAAQRGPLLPGLPPLVLVDVRGHEEASAGSRSAFNRAEAAATAQARAVPLPAPFAPCRHHSMTRMQRVLGTCLDACGIGQASGRASGLWWAHLSHIMSRHVMGII